MKNLRSFKELWESNLIWVRSMSVKILSVLGLECVGCRINSTLIALLIIFNILNIKVKLIWILNIKIQVLQDSKWIMGSKIQWIIITIINTSRINNISRIINTSKINNISIINKTNTTNKTKWINKTNTTNRTNTTNKIK